MASWHFMETATDRTRQLAISGVVWFGLIAGAGFLFFFNPSSPSNQFFPQCPFRLITGWQCPGCGTTRAFYQLLHLHPIAAFKFNPLTVLMLPFVIYLLLGYTSGALLGKPSRQMAAPNKYLWAGIVLVFFFWIFRNTPWYPFVS